MAKRNPFSVELRKTEAFKFESIKDARAFEKAPSLKMFFSPEDADDLNKTLKIKIDGDLPVSDEFFVREIKRIKSVIIIAYRVMVKISVDGKFTEDDFDNWAQEQGGWATMYCEPQDYDCEPADYDGHTYLGSKDEYGFSLNEQ